MVLCWLLLAGCATSGPKADPSSTSEPPAATGPQPTTSTPVAPVPSTPTDSAPLVETGFTASTHGRTPTGATGGPTDTGPAPVCASLLFTTADWTPYDNGAYTPQLTGGTDVGLIPDNLGYAGAAVVWGGALTPPFVLELDVQIYDDDGVAGPSSTNTADGLAVQFLKDPDVYATTRPPNGGSLGHVLDGTGYALEVDVYADRNVRLVRGNGNVLAQRATDTYTGTGFEHVVITVDSNGIEAAFGTVVLTTPGPLDTAFEGLVLSAGTGGSDGRHVVSNVVLCPG